MCKDRKLVLDLKAEIALDYVKNTIAQSPWKQNRSPAYKRRQERRRASRSAAEEATAVKDEAEEAKTVNEEAEKQTFSNSEITDVAENVAVTSKITPSSRNIKENDGKFECKSCDFSSKWEFGLQVHVKCVHAENLGAAMKEKYDNTSSYWKGGHLGTFYQRFLDANELVEGLGIPEQEQIIEKILEARKLGFNGNNWKNFPPWSK